MQDAAVIKERIVSIIKNRGPCLPINVSKDIGLSSLFTSAFLSELIADKLIKMSYMRIGSSPIYFVSEDESKLEKFSHHLKSKEKEAFTMIKDNQILEHENLDPAIRVALASIRDFAFPFKYNEKIYWKYFTFPDDDALEEAKRRYHGTVKLEEKAPEILEEKELVKEIEQVVEIIQKEEIKEKKVKLKKPKAKKKASKQDDQFFNKVKEYLSNKSIEILDIEGINKDNLTLRVKESKKEKILVAYNKKKIGEEEILKAFKKSQETNLGFIILSLGEPPKKLTNLIEALKNLESIEKLE